MIITRWLWIFVVAIASYCEWAFIVGSYLTFLLGMTVLLSITLLVMVMRVS